MRLRHHQVYRLLTLSFVLLIMSLPYQAQGETWLAWLYNAGNGDMLQVDGRGFIQRQVSLPLPIGYDFYPFDVAVAENGDRVAYVAADTEQGQHLMIYDTFRQRLVLEYPLPELFTDSIGFVSYDTNIFNSSASALAFGFSLAEGGWQIQIVDVQAGLATQVLRSGAANLEALNLPDEAGLTPVVRSFDDVEVVFTLTQANALGQVQSERGSFRWNIRTNVVQPTDAYLALDADIFAPTGEIVQVGVDSHDDESVVPNTLYAYIPTTTSRISFYRSQTSGLFSPRFIQNGEFIMVGRFDSTGKPSFFSVKRAGTVQSDWDDVDEVVVTSLRGTADGFAYTVSSLTADGSGLTTLFGVDSRNGLNAGTALLRLETKTSPRLVWMQDSRLQRGAFEDWVPLNDEAESIPSYQINTWNAWIYEDSGRAIRVNHRGESLDVVLIDLPKTITTESPDALPRNINVSQDGRYFAFVFTENGLPKTLQIYDTERNSVKFDYAIPHDGSTAIPSHTIDRAPESHLFDETNQHIAFGFGLGLAGWQITVLDVNNGDVLYTLQNDSAAMNRFATETSFGVVPIVQKVTDSEIYFTVHPVGELEPPYASFIWNFVSDAVRPSLLFINAQADTFTPTNETILALPDERLPNNAEDFGTVQLQALHVYDPRSATRYPFYNAQELWLFTPEFIQNGERVLVGGTDAQGEFLGSFVLERDGEIVGVVPLAGDLWEAEGVGNGFIYILRDEPDDSLTLRLVNTREQLNSGEIIWRDTRTGRPQLAWAGYDAQAVTNRNWAQLADPIPVSGISSPLNSDVIQALKAGKQVVVNTLGGDALNVRTEPGRGYALTTRLNAGTRLTLLSGPRNIGGENWWLIRTPSGVEGWVIEAADGIRTLIPVG